MGDDSKRTGFVLDLDNKEFVKKLRESLGLMGELGKADSLKDLGGMFIKIGTLAGVAGAAILAAKAALDWTEEAEKIRQIENSFYALADSVHVSADAIRDGLVREARGLIDTTDLLQAANKAMISLGENSERIVDVMSVSRKATAVFGGELLDNFEKINLALSTGNNRALRQFGIVVDSEEAQKKYAKSIGTTVEYLNDAGKKQAFFNEALDQANKRFKGVDETSVQTSKNLTKIKVAFNELGETAVLAWDKIAGPTVRAATKAVADAMQGLSDRAKAAFGSGVEQAEAKRRVLEREIETLKELSARTEATNQKYGIDLNTHAEALKRKQAELVKLNEEEEKADMRDMKRRQAAGPKEVEKTPDDHENLAKKAADKLKFERDIEAIRIKRLEADLEAATTEQQVNMVFAEREISLRNQAELEKARLKKEGLDTHLIDQQQYAAAVENIELTLNDKLKFMAQDLQDARIKALENAQRAAQTTSEGMAAAFALGSARAKADLTNYGKTGEIVFGAVKKNAVNAFRAMGDGSKTAGEAMRGFILGAIADTAEAKGAEMLLAGIWPPNPAAIAAGGALIALASALRAQAEGQSKVAGVGGAASGGGSEPSAPGVDKPEAQEPQQRKAVTLNIYGSYYETEQTRTRLMEMIRESGDYTDFNLKQIGQA